MGISGGPSLSDATLYTDYYIPEAVYPGLVEGWVVGPLLEQVESRLEGPASVRSRSV